MSLDRNTDHAGRGGATVLAAAEIGRRAPCVAALLTCGPLLLIVATCSAQSSAPQVPSDWDLFALRLVNAARTDPQAENAARGTNYSNPPVPPLAYDLLLGRAAENHTHWMSSNEDNPSINNPANFGPAPDSFTHHESFNGQANGAPATGTPWFTGKSGTSRVNYTGFSWSSWGENILWSSYPAEVDQFRILSNHSGFWRSDGHRNSMMSSSYTVFGHYALSETYHYDTQEYARPSGSPNTHVLGVFYDDRDGSGGWEPHDSDDPMREGLGNVLFRVYESGTMDQIGDDAFTFDNGGFSFRTGNGNFDIEFVHDGVGTWVRDVLVSNANTDIGDVVCEPIGSLAGDFNLNGLVDAADYTMWRDGLGTTFTPADYDVWRMNFGNLSSGGGASLESAVPEQASWRLLAGLVILGTLRCRTRGRKIRGARGHLLNSGRSKILSISGFGKILPVETTRPQA